VKNVFEGMPKKDEQGVVSNVSDSIMPNLCYDSDDSDMPDLIDDSYEELGDDGYLYFISRL
jgi:hypothetical protein